MEFYKSLFGMYFDSDSFNEDDISLLYNAYVLLHKEKNIIGITSNLDNLSEENKEDRFVKNFLNKDDYTIKIVRGGELIENPTNKDFNFLKKEYLLVRYTKFIKHLKSLNYLQKKG